MELIISFIVVGLGIFAAALSRQLTDEFKAWTPWIIKHLVKGAVRRLAEQDRSRFEEEWLAHVNEIPGEVGKIIDALGFFYAAQRISLRISVPKRIKREQKWNGQTVLLFKFRTEGLAGRRTRVGQFLLSSNLDQLPTLINILRLRSIGQENLTSPRIPRTASLGYRRKGAEPWLLPAISHLPSSYARARRRGPGCLPATGCASR
jgi:hypothetical protein